MGTAQVKNERMRNAPHALLVGVSLVALIAPSYAADLPFAKAPAPAPIPSWAGFYLGLHGGYGWAHDDFSDPFALVTSTPQPINGIRSQDALYGAHAGYNWQFGRAVTGLEFDFSRTDLKGSNGISETALLPGIGEATQSITLRQSLQYLGSARTRLGWVPADDILVYGTAGLAWGRFDRTLEDVGSGAFGSFVESSRVAISKFGWVAGVGTEVALGDSNWIGRAEYLHYQFGSLLGALALNGPGLTLNATSGNVTVDVVRAGLSYRFNDSMRVAPALYAKEPLATASTAWTGFYLGAHGGYAWADDPYTDPIALFSAGDDVVRGTRSGGWIAGGHLGHNWQYDRIVTGFEADFSAAGIKGTTNTATDIKGGTLAFDEKAKYLGTLRGRLGFTPSGDILLYGTAGLAWERFERTEIDTIAPGGGVTTTGLTTPSDQFGWVAGVGGEMMLGNSNWIGRLEYLHYDFAHVLPDFVENDVSTSSGHQTVDLVRAGVSYKFGAASPLTALAMAGKEPHLSSQSWAGFYLGGHGGYGWQNNNLTSQTTGTSGVYPFGRIKSQGWIAGGHAGYNWQQASLVAGLEVDGTATGISGQSSRVAFQAAPGVTANITTALSDNVKYLGTFRGRVGWTPAPGWLLYGTGGLAWERTDRTRSAITTAGASVTTSVGVELRDQFGWVAGLGAETFLGSSSWIARLEYLHYDFGKVEETSTTSSTVPGAFQSADRGGHQTIETVRAGVSYKFAP